METLRVLLTETRRHATEGMPHESHSVFHNLCSSYHSERPEKMRILLRAAARLNLHLVEPVMDAADAMGLEGFPEDIADMIVGYLPPPAIDQQTSEGKTPLMCAVHTACNGQTETVETAWLLLQAGADPTITDDEGNTALDWMWTSLDLS